MKVNRGVGSVRVWIQNMDGEEWTRWQEGEESKRSGKSRGRARAREEKNGRIETLIIGLDDAERVLEKSREHEPLLPILGSLQSGDGGFGDQSPRNPDVVCFHGMDVGRSCSDKLGVKLIFALYRWGRRLKDVQMRSRQVTLCEFQS